MYLFLYIIYFNFNKKKEKIDFELKTIIVVINFEVVFAILGTDLDGSV